mmetsp:Transcript_47596/g.95893  ORF Transcript_47596/g.95893 Transcript_47596/m.95893 type:complete len:211 (-) Transcript_47596:924-1556(-)
MSRHCWLSGKSDLAKSMPSSLYTASSCLKVTSLNSFWRRSLARLMSSWSRPLGARFSKPNMSSTPMKLASSFGSLSNALFTRTTISSKSALKMCLATPSRAATDAWQSCGLTTVLLPGMTRTCVTSAWARDCGFTPRSADAVVRTAMSLTREASGSPSGMKVTFPRCRQPAKILKISNCSWSAISTARIESTVNSNSSLSSIPSTLMHPL